MVSVSNQIRKNLLVDCKAYRDVGGVWQILDCNARCGHVDRSDEKMIAVIVQRAVSDDHPLSAAQHNAKHGLVQGPNRPALLLGDMEANSRYRRSFRLSGVAVCEIGESFVHQINIDFTERVSKISAG